MVGPALLFRAQILGGAGRWREAKELLVELLRAHDLADCWLHQLPLVLAELGGGREYLAALGDEQPTTPWLDAGCAAATGDFGRAAEVYQVIGARAAEAQSRLLAAEALIASGRRAEAGAELARALDCFRSVGATAYTSRGERLLTASA